MKGRILEKLKKVSLIVFDVDGVLTDGRLYYSGDENEAKSFYAKDAPRIAIALKSGLKIVWVTARASIGVMRRSSELKVDLISKQELKRAGKSFLDMLQERYGSFRDQILYVGDDWSDLYLMQQAGVAVTPVDGSSENKKIAALVTKAHGGYGVAAEVIESVMRAQGTWEKSVKAYLKELTY